MTAPYDDEKTFDLLAAIKTGAHLENTEFPPLSWAVPGLIPEGMGLFTGPPKVGKSWAVLSLGLAVATGGLALGKVPVGKPRPVLYFALEDGERRLKGRCRKLLGDGVKIPANLRYLTDATPNRVIPTIRAWLDAWANDNPLVLLDTLGKVMPPALPGEGAYDRDYRIGGALKSTVDDNPGSTLMVVHHVRKMAGADWMDSTSGTNGLNGSADFTLNLSRDRNQDTGMLRVTGRDVVEAEYSVTTADGNWTLDGNDLNEAADKAQQGRNTANLGDRSSEIVGIVSEHPDGIGPSAVGERLGITPSNATTYLRRLEDAGRIAKASRGRYTPVTSVTSVTLDGLDDVNVTQVTDVTPVLRCTVCSFPLPDSVAADGFTTHPGCAA